MNWSPDSYVAALNLASAAHLGQCVPGTSEPYLRHVASVAAEVMSAIAARGDVDRPDLAVQCALLHDVVEDTDVGLDTLRRSFGEEVADGVDALTKDESLPDKASRMKDSLRRIKAQPVEVWMVKLADRITNLQPAPKHWDAAKIERYRDEAKLIAEELGDACPVLRPRLLTKIAAY